MFFKEKQFCAEVGARGYTVSALFLLEVIAKEFNCVLGRAEIVPGNPKGPVNRKLSVKQR